MSSVFMPGLGVYKKMSANKLYHRLIQIKMEAPFTKSFIATVALIKPKGIIKNL